MGLQTCKTGKFKRIWRILKKGALDYEAISRVSEGSVLGIILLFIICYLLNSLNDCIC